MKNRALSRPRLISFQNRIVDHLHVFEERMFSHTIITSININKNKKKRIRHQASAAIIEKDNTYYWNTYYSGPTRATIHDKHAGLGVINMNGCLPIHFLLQIFAELFCR